MNQVGSVIVFKPEVSEDEARAALEKLNDVLEYEPNVVSFDPAWGGPVWYVP